MNEVDLDPSIWLGVAICGIMVIISCITSCIGDATMKDKPCKACQLMPPVHTCNIGDPNDN